MLMSSGAPATAKDDPTLPLNAQLRQATLGVTSEGFQASQARRLAACAACCLLHAACCLLPDSSLLDSSPLTAG
jgi:hypothetical protein